MFLQGQQSNPSPETHDSTSLETVVLSIVDELQPEVGFLMTDPFASHVLRVLLVILAGWSNSIAGSAASLQSRKKENVSVNGQAKGSEVSYPVPPSYRDAVQKIMASVLVGLDINTARALATQPIANPVLQLCLELELKMSGKTSVKQPESLLRKLLPTDGYRERSFC